MAIYISGVRNLPEQVQKNKDDIETLEGRIGTAEGDITSLKGRMDTAEGDIDSLETKTQQLSYDGVNNRENFSGDVEIDGNVLVNSMQNKDNYGAITIPNQANDDVVIINASSGTAYILKLDKDGNLINDGSFKTTMGDFDTQYGSLKGGSVISGIINVPHDLHHLNIHCWDSNNTNHTLQFDADTLKLTIDGNEVGGATLYQHNISIYSTAVGRAVIFYCSIITTDSTPLTATTFKNYINTNHKAYNKALLCNGVYYNGTNSFVIDNIYYDAPNYNVGFWNSVGLSHQSFNPTNTDFNTLVDNVVAIS